MPLNKRILKQTKTNNVDLKNYTEIDDLYQFEHRRLGADSYKLGIITDIRQVGGYPEYAGKARVDSDGDGMPDDYENKFKKLGYNANDASDANQDFNKDGYTNIEGYINAIDPNTTIDWKNLKNNVDTLNENGGVDSKK